MHTRTIFKQSLRRVWHEAYEIYCLPFGKETWNQKKKSTEEAAGLKSHKHSQVGWDIAN